MDDPSINLVAQIPIGQMSETVQCSHLLETESETETETETEFKSSAKKFIKLNLNI